MKQTISTSQGNQYRVLLEAGAGLSLAIIKRIIEKRISQERLDIVRIETVNYNDSNIENEVKNLKDLKKAKSIKELFSIVQRIEPNLQPQLKQEMAELIKFEDELSKKMDASTKQIDEINDALEQRIKKTQAALRRSRKIG